MFVFDSSSNDTNLLDYSDFNQSGSSSFNVSTSFSASGGYTDIFGRFARSSAEAASEGSTSETYQNSGDRTQQEYSSSYTARETFTQTSFSTFEELVEDDADAGSGEDHYYNEFINGTSNFLDQIIQTVAGGVSYRQVYNYFHRDNAFEVTHNAITVSEGGDPNFLQFYTFSASRDQLTSSTYESGLTYYSIHNSIYSSSSQSGSGTSSSGQTAEEGGDFGPFTNNPNIVQGSSSTSFSNSTSSSWTVNTGGTYQTSTTVTTVSNYTTSQEGVSFITFPVVGYNSNNTQFTFRYDTIPTVDFSTRTTTTEVYTTSSVDPILIDAIGIQVYNQLYFQSTETPQRGYLVHNIPVNQLLQGSVSGSLSEVGDSFSQTTVMGSDYWRSTGYPNSLFVSVTRGSVGFGTPVPTVGVTMTHDGTTVTYQVFGASFSSYPVVTARDHLVGDTTLDSQSAESYTGTTHTQSVGIDSFSSSRTFYIPESFTQLIQWLTTYTSVFVENKLNDGDGFLNEFSRFYKQDTTRVFTFSSYTSSVMTSYSERLKGIITFENWSDSSATGTNYSDSAVVGESTREDLFMSASSYLTIVANGGSTSSVHFYQLVPGFSSQDYLPNNLYGIVNNHGLALFNTAGESDQLYRAFTYEIIPEPGKAFPPVDIYLDSFTGQVAREITGIFTDSGSSRKMSFETFINPYLYSIYFKFSNTNKQKTNIEVATETQAAFLTAARYSFFGNNSTKRRKVKTKATLNLGVVSETARIIGVVANTQRQAGYGGMQGATEEVATIYNAMSPQIRQTFNDSNQNSTHRTSPKAEHGTSYTIPKSQLLMEQLDTIYTIVPDGELVLIFPSFAVSTNVSGKVNARTFV